MKNVRRFEKFFACGLFTFLFIFTNISCEIGLGEAVDIDRPTVSISYPPRNAIIRDRFVLSGKTGDDKGVNYIKVTAKNASTGKSFEKTIQMNGMTDGQWSINLNEPLDAAGKVVDPTDPTPTFDHWEFSDAKYTIDVIAYDFQNKDSGAASITLEIDNTAPDFTATLLGTANYTKPTEYGTSLKVTGTVDEAHEIASMELKVYNVDGNGVKTSSTPITVLEGSEQKPIIQDNVPTTGGIEVVFADATKTGLLKNRYEALYGEAVTKDSKTTKNYLTELVLTDNAKEYKNPSVGVTNEDGNKTTLFNLKEDNLYGIEQAYFSLNPSNNPKFNIGAYAYHSGEANGPDNASASNNTSVSISFISGRDNVNINPASLRVYLVGPIDKENYNLDFANEVYDTDQWLKETTAPVTEDGATVDLSSYTVTVPASFTKFKPDTAATPAAGKTRVKELPNKRNVDGDRYYLDSSAESLSYDYQIGDSDLTSGKYYLIVAVGQDQDGNHLVHSDTYYYGFKAQTTGKDPEIEITDRPAVKSGKYTNNPSLTYKGKAKADGSDTIYKIIYRVRVMDGRDEVYSQKKEHEIDYTQSPAKEIDWQFTFDLSSKVSGYDENKVYNVEVYVKAEDSGERKSSDKYESLIVDMEPPVFEITNIVPSLTYTGLDNVERKGVVNGEVEVFFEAKDLTNFDKWEYEINIGETKKGPFTEQNTAGSIKLDTATYDKKNVEFKVTAYDVAGNTINYSSNDYFNKIYGTTGSYYIDKDSDEPQITISAKETVTDPANVKEGDNLYSVSGSKAPSITVTVTDDDQLNKVWAKVKKDGESTWKEFYTETFDTATTSTNGQIYLTSNGKKDGTVWEEGKYYVQIFATDGKVENQTEVFALGITKKRPVVKVTTTSGKYYSNPHSVAVAGTIDENVTAKLEVSYELDDRTTGTSVPKNKTKDIAANKAAVTALAGNFTDTITVGTADSNTIKVATAVTDGILTASYVGYDDYGQPSVEAIFTYLIDGKAPTVDGKTIFKWSDGSDITSDWTNKNTIKLNSTPEDKTPVGENGSGIASIQYGVFNHSPLTPSDKSDDTKWTTVASGADRNVTLDDGTSYIFIRATDNAGNTAYSTTPQTVKVDTAKPVIALNTLAENVDGTADLTISGTASDTAGLDSTGAVVIEVTGNKASDGTPQTLKPTVTGTTSFSATLTAAEIKSFAEGKFTVKAIAKDVIGNTSEDTKDVVYDNHGPRVEILTPVVNEWQNSTTVKVTGTVTDYSTEGLAVYYAFGNESFTEPARPAKADATTATKWTSNGWKAATVKNGAWSFTPSTPSFAEKGNKVYIRAVDKYGNVTADETSRIVKVDNANPVIVKTNYKKNGGSSESLADVASIILDKNNFELSGTYSDSASNVTLSATRKKSGESTAASVTVTGTPASGTALSGTWSINESVALADGIYEYEIVGTDETHKSGSTTLTVTVDTTKPAFVTNSMKVSSTKEGLSANAYNASKWYPNTPIFLSGKWTEDGSGIDHINYWIKTTEADPTGAELSAPKGSIKPSKAADGKWTFEQSLDFNLGNNWVYMKAVDIAGNEEASFAKFKINMDNEAPTLVLNQSGNLYKKDADSITISGKVTDNKSGVNSAYAICIFAGDYDAKYENKNTPAGQIALIAVNETSGVKSDGTFTVSIPLSTIKTKAGTKDLYKISVVASDGMENRTTKDFTLYRDNAGPEIKRDSIATLIDESASGGKAYTVNGKVTIKGDSTDAVEDVSETTVAVYPASGITVNATTGAVSGLSGKTAKATYKKNKTTETPDATNTIVANSGSTLKKWNYTIDTLKFSTLNGTGDNTEYVIVITAKDGSGNENTYGEKIFVKQSTDLPKVTPSNYTATVNAAANIKLGTNLFDKNGNKSLMASITDDDKLNSVKVEYHATTTNTEPAANSTGWKTFFTSDSNLNTAAYTLTAPLVKGGNGADKNDPLDVGKYFIRITATDNNSPAVTTITTPFLIAVDNTAPVIESVQINSKDVTENTFAAKTHTVVFTVSDDTEPGKVEYTTDGGKNWSSTGVTSIGSGTSKTFSHEFTVADAKVDTFTGYQYRVVDIYGRETGKTLKYKMDVTAPKVSTTNVTVKSKASGDVAYSDLGTKWFNGDSVTVTATDVVSDTNLVRDVAVTISGATEDSAKTIGLDISGTNPLKGSFINTRALNDGSSTIKYVFKDEAELTVPLNVTVKVDKTAPVLDGTATVKAGGTTLTNAGNVYTNATSVTLEFTAKDNFGGLSTVEDSYKVVSGLSKAYIGTKEGFADSEAIKTITLSGTECSIPATAINISSYNNDLQLYLRLEDNAGNKSSDMKIADFKIDRVAPTVRIDPVKDADGVSTNGTQVNKTITLTGEVVEENLKDSIVYLYIDSGTKAVANGTIGADKKWSITYDTDTTTLSDSEVKHTFKVETEDKAGVKGSDSVDLKVDQDTDRPIVTFAKLDPSATSAANGITLNEGKIEGTIFDDDDDDTNVVKKLEFKLEYTKDGAKKTIDWTEATISGDTWSYEINNTDGTDFTYTLYTRVTDNNNAVFSNDTEDESETDYAGKSKLLQAGSTTEKENAFIFSVDNTPPTIGKLQVAVKPNGGSYGTYSDWSDNQKFGGKTREKIKIKIPASDAITTDSSELTVTVKVGENPETTLNKATNYDTTNGWWTYEIDFSTLGQDSDTLVIQIGVADKSGKPRTVNPYLIIDNLGPTEIQNVTPSKNTAMTGTVEVTGSVKDNDNGSGVEKIYYYVPEATSASTKETDPETIANSKWIVLEGGSTFSAKLDYLNNGTEIIAKYAGWASNELYQIPVWFKMEDAFGNIGYNTENSIKYDPNADKPTLKVLNPTENATLSTGALKDGTKNYVVLGGIIGFQGTAYDDEGISGVYVQYDTNGDGNYMDATDLAWLQTNGYEVKTLEEWTKAELGNTFAKLPNDRKNDKVVKAKGTTSWSTTFQTNDLPEETNTTCLEIGNTMNEANRTLNIRVCTVDADTIDAAGQCVSGWDVVHVSVNRSIPQMALKLKRYSSDNPAADATPIEIKDYTKDMYISGQHWFLEGDVTDTDGINEIAYTNGVFYQGSTSNTGYTGNAVLNNAAVAATGHATVIAGSSDKNFHLRIPVVTSTNTDNNYYENITRFTLTVTAYDRDGNGNQRKSTRENFYINIDNTAPAFYKGEDSDGKPNIAAFAVYQDGYGGTELSASAYIRNSSGPQMTIGSAAMEEGSGFDKAVFYLKRTGKKKVYNVMESTNGAGYLDARNASDLTKVYIKDDLPVLEMTVTTTSNTLTAAGIGTNNNIRVGGLVYFGGAYRLISGKSGNTVTLSEQVETEDTTAYFVYASVVDHSGEDGTAAKDDDDGLFESLIYMNNFVKWDATFNTANIPDGPIELHVVVFDKAGNVNHSSVATRIWNNPPRLAKVTIGTDLNGDGYFVKDDGEISEFVHTKRATSDGDYFRADGNYYDQVWNISYDDAKSKLKDDKSIDWKIKNKLLVKPEFVGGNGDIFYKFAKAVGNGDDKKLTAASTGSFTSVTDYKKDAALGKLKPIGYMELPNNVINSTTGEYSGTGPVTPNTYQFSFWDSTDDLTPGSTSQWTVLNIELAQDLEDTIAPIVTITPFFWKGRGLAEEGEEPLNSIQWEGADGEYTALGHIELAEDIAAESTLATYEVPAADAIGTVGQAGYVPARDTAVFGNDPKVSGKIVIRGTASDETILKKLKFSFDSLTMTNCEVSYDSTHKGWGTYVAATDAQGTEGEEGYQPAVPAHFTMPSSTTEGWSINIIDANGPTQTGHSIKWELYIDTAKLTGKVGLNKKVKVKAYDGTNWSTNKQENTYADTEQYQMDVVPYVVEVVTELSSLNANASIYNRTALGHYPVRGAARNAADNTMNTTTGETITLKGFNLDDGNYETVNYETVSKKVDEVDEYMASGMFVPSVNGIPAINNINNNNAKGAYTGTITDVTGKGTKYDSEYETLVEWAYNRLPNNENNNLLNDDIYFDVWDINDRAAVPAQGKLEGVHMAIAPASSGYSNQNMIQFGAAFGNMMFGLGTTGDTPYSLASWNTRDTTNSDAIMVGGNGFHIDANGNTWGTNYNGEEIEIYAVVGSLFGNTAGRSKTEIGLEKFQQDGNRMKTRFQSTTMASTTGKLNTNLYLAYYDSLNNQIRFRAGNITAKQAGDYGQLKNTYTSVSSSTDAKYNTDIKNVQVIAGSSTRLGAGPSIKKNNISRNAGNFVSIDVIKANTTGNSNGTDVVVAVWYDADTANGNKMMYSYTTTPLSNSGAATGNNGAIDKPADGWSDPEEIFIGGGEYCQVKVAADGSIHMAAYANGNLEYAYKRSYSSETTVKTTVDAVYDTGTYITLDVALVDSNPVPYIGYYAGSKPKYAYLNNTSSYTAAGLAGVVSGSDLVNQNWEISVVPTASTLRLSSAEKINVGVWKTTTGVLNWSTTNGKDPDAESDAGTVGTTTWTRNGTSTTAQVYGNGTKNGVVAYVVNNKGKETTTCLETAQKRD